MNRFLVSEEGQGLVEYALIIAVIAIGAITAALFLRDQISATSEITSPRP